MSWCADTSGIIDEIFSNSEAGSFRPDQLLEDGIVQPRCICASVGYILAALIGNIVVVDKKYGLGAFDSSTGALCKSAEFVG